MTGAYLPRLAIDSSEIKKEGELYSTLLKHYSKSFYETLYHGTTPENAISILKEGVLESTKKHGHAAFGPGFYAARKYEDAEIYEKGIVLKFELASNANIISLDDIDDHFRDLFFEAEKKGYIKNYSSRYQGIYSLLRDRNQYAVDVILVRLEGYVIILNQNALVMPDSLKSSVESSYSEVEKYRGFHSGRFFKKLLKYAELDMSICKLDESQNECKINSDWFKPDSYGRSALTFAIDHNLLTFAKWILNKSPETVLEDKHVNGHTILTYAIQNNPQIAEMIVIRHPQIINKKASIRDPYKTYTITPIEHAKQHDHHELVRIKNDRLQSLKKEDLGKKESIVDTNKQPALIFSRAQKRKSFKTACKKISEIYLGPDKRIKYDKFA